MDGVCLRVFSDVVQQVASYVPHNYTRDKIMNNDGNYTDVKITNEYVNDLFKTMNIVVKI